MAKHLRTSGDYTVKTGTGASGSNSVIFDSKETEPIRYGGFFIGCLLLYQVGKNLRGKNDDDFLK